MVKPDTIIKSITFYCEKLDKDVTLEVPELSGWDDETVNIWNCPCGESHSQSDNREKYDGS